MKAGSVYLFWYIIFTFSVLLGNYAKASIVYNNNCKRAYEFALAFHFDKMDSVLKVEKSANPDNSVIYSIETSASFLKYISTEREDYLDEFECNFDIARENIDNESDENPYKRLILTDLYLESTFINSINSNFITALFQFKRAYKYIQQNNYQFPNFVLNKRSLGLMNVVLGSIPKSYNWTLSLLSMEGDLKLGNTQLQEFMLMCKSQRKYNYLYVESVVLYSFTHYNYGNKQDSVDILSDIFADKILNDKYFDNQVYTFAKASYYSHKKLNELAITELLNIQDEINSNKYKLYYLDYMYGESLLYKNNIKSKEYFRKYIDGYPGKNYIKSAYLYIAWNYLLYNNNTAYIREKSEIINNGRLLFDTDKQAQKEAENNVLPNVSLLKSRLLFDGGYFNKADSVLNKAFLDGDFITQKDKIEYIYRLARIYDEMGDFKVAEIYYKLTIEKGKDLPYYFAANSALNLAYHYEDKKDFVAAAEMYNLCLDMDFDEYQNSITQKAKAGLNRFKKN